MRRILPLATLVATLALGATHSWAQIVSANIYTTAHTSPSDALASTDTAGAGTAATTNWNNVNITSAGYSTISASNLPNNAGTATTLGFSFTPNGGGASTVTGGGSTPIQKLYGSGDTMSNNGSFPASLTISNIPYASYNLYVYFNAGFSDRSVSFTVGSTTYYATPSTVTTSYTQATSATSTSPSTANYVKFTGLTGSSLSLSSAPYPKPGGDGNTRATAFCGFQIESAGSAPVGAIPGPPSFGSNYKLVWSQDFTLMTALAQLNAVAGYTMAGGTWISHTPSHQDWFTFIDPVDNNNPFGLGSGFLNIRVANRGYGDPNNWFSGYSGGLLSSMDSTGKGFAQQYGYFECSMQCPGGPNTWPAFWLLDAPTLTNKTLPYGAEVDVTESYGNWGTGPNQSPAGDPNNSSMTWHKWGQNGNPSTSGSSYTHQPGMTTGYHTYGVDIEPTTTTWYFDRVQVWSAPTVSSAQAPMFVLLNLALGGGNYNNSTNTGYNWTLTPNPSDLKVKYVAVYASPNSPNYSTVAATPTGLAASASTGQVALSWAATSGASSYNIYRGTSAGGEATLPIETGMVGTSYTDKAVTSGTTYYYKIKAVYAGGVTAFSNEANGHP